MNRLKIVAFAIILTLTGINIIQSNDFNSFMKKNFPCGKDREFRNGQCRKKVNKKKITGALQSLPVGIDTSLVAQNAHIIVNNSQTPQNAATLTFYDTNKTAINAPTTIFYNGQFVAIPDNAEHLTITYTASNENNDIIPVLDVDLDPKKSYSLTNPNSNTQPKDSSAPWVLTPVAHNSDFAVLLQTTTPHNFLPSIMGGNSNTYAPQTFKPDSQFSGSGLVGNYFSSSKVATIHDPSGANSQSYSFENVQMGGMQAPAGLELIGTYTSSPRCSGNVCSNAIMRANLYGSLVPNN